MSQGKKIATRESYGRTLAELGKEHEDFLVLDADLAGSTKTAVFRKAFPERDPRRHLGRRGRRDPPVQRGLCADAHHPGHGGHGAVG